MIKEKNYWPHAIAGILLMGVVAGGWTIKIALDNPVEMDTFYLQKYQQVDDNINNIVQKQIEFTKKYKIELLTKSFNVGKNDIIFDIKDKQNKSILADELEILLTRPDSSQFDFKVNIKNPNSTNEYIIKQAELSKEGRWQVLVKTKIGQEEGFEKMELMVIR